MSLHPRRWPSSRAPRQPGRATEPFRGPPTSRADARNITAPPHVQKDALTAAGIRGPRGNIAAHSRSIRYISLDQRAKPYAAGVDRVPGGVLTILSPWIPPVLPFVFTRADRSFVANGLPMLAGMTLTFAAAATLAAVGGAWAVRLNEYGRVASLALLAALAATLLSRRLADGLAATLRRSGQPIDAGARRRTGANRNRLVSMLLGVATGLLWAPCAGPILGLCSPAPRCRDPRLTPPCCCSPIPRARRPRSPSRFSRAAGCSPLSRSRSERASGSGADSASRCCSAVLGYRPRLGQLDPHAALRERHQPLGTFSARPRRRSGPGIAAGP